MIDSILKVAMGIGAAALVVLVGALVVAGTATSARAPVAHRPSYRAAGTPNASSGKGVATKTTPVAHVGQAVVSSATPVPSPPAATSPVCSSAATCEEALVVVINTARAKRGLAPLVLDRLQSSGTSGCAGSHGHSRAMAKSGRLWRVNARFPRASYPRNICRAVRHAAENVGRARGSTWQAVQTINAAMLTPGRHPKDYKHLMSKRYHRIGIGFAHRHGYYYLTEDFLP